MDLNLNLNPNPYSRRPLFSSSSSSSITSSSTYLHLPNLLPTKLRFTNMRLMKLLAACLFAFPVFVTVSFIFRHTTIDNLGGFAEARVFDSAKIQSGSRAVSSQTVDMFQDRLLGGLLATGFDERSCASRYQSGAYRKVSSHKPSSYLLSKLRNYEDLHRRCGPHTKSYNETLKQIKAGNTVAASTECNYIVWISFSGLGNRILTLASAFLYALLTNRVLLVDRGKDMADLFCEPFPDESWLLPLDFPLTNQFNGFDQNSPNCYGNMLKNNIIDYSKVSMPSFMYLHLVHNYQDHDKMFFCEQDQTLLKKVPWLIMKTDNYFVPSLFLIPSFEHELSNLFPEKETVFHHLGRYLLHPSNQVWGLISRYYQAYLANADERIGIQVRVFDTGKGPFPYVMDQILACTLKEKLLPRLNMQESAIISPRNQRSKAVLVTSLNSGYYENISNMYWEHPTTTGEIISFFQPSHEEYQQTEKKNHNRKAWAEMFLLSLTDKLITSSWSTFGYVAQGLGGLNAWILYKPENQTAPNPPCRRTMSMEPCFHAPPFYDCKAKRGIDTGLIVPHVRHCEDMSWGLKVVGAHDEL